jgi:8-oxo-dGTP pyrophosphatase MutT (NUDIX family)
MELEKSAGTVIFRKDKEVLYYLLLHYQVGHWDFPKGNIEKGEQITETARRETKEETGIGDIEFIQGFKEEIEYFYQREGKRIYKTVIFFLSRTRTKEVKISFEHQGFEWLNYEKALKKLTHKNAKEILKKANKVLLKIET